MLSTMPCIEIQALESMILKTIREMSKQLKADHLFTENLACIFTEIGGQCKKGFTFNS